MKKTNILLTGGGTGGSVTPLLAIVEEINLSDENCDYIWIGTHTGLEKKMVDSIVIGADKKIKYVSIYSGKLRRYFSWKNFIDPFKILFGFFKSIILIFRYKPNIIISAGSFVSVPVVISGWLFGIPILVHQQDIRPGLANKLMAPFAKKITVTFEKSLKDYGKKAVWTGNPIRLKLTKLKKENLSKNKLPNILIVGGGTGSEAINKIVEKIIDELLSICNIFHITGRNKEVKIIDIPNYKQYDFVTPDEIINIYATTNLAISRCGIGTLTELSYFKIPSILIPLPETHQVDNALFFKEKEAAVVLSQKDLTKDLLVEEIKKILDNEELSQKYANNIKKIFRDNSNKLIIKEINSIIKK